MSTAFEAEMREFMGEMREFKSTTERRLGEQRAGIDAINTKATQLDVINARLENPAVCPAHATILRMLEENEEADKGRDEKIVDNEKKVMLVEYKLSTSDVAKITGLATVLATALVELVRIVSTVIFKG